MSPRRRDPETVVVFAQEADAPVDAVVRALDARGVAVFRADTSWFPQSLALDAMIGTDGLWTGTLATEHRSVDLGDIRSIWYRDPSAFVFTPELTDIERAYAHREARLGLGGVLSALPVLWVNHPNRAADAVYKPLQLATARRCGLDVPPTLVTNVPASVTRFATGRNTVCKSFGPNSVTEGGALKVAFTHRLDDLESRDLSGVASTATQVQQWVEKDFEARIVVIGEALFTFTIHAGSDDARTDWRADFDALRYALIDHATRCRGRSPPLHDGVRTRLRRVRLLHRP